MFEVTVQQVCIRCADRAKNVSMDRSKLHHGVIFNGLEVMTMKYGIVTV